MCSRQITSVYTIKYNKMHRLNSDITLQELTDNNIQPNCDHIFTCFIPVFDGSKKEDSFEWVESLDATCIQSEGYIY